MYLGTSGLTQSHIAEVKLWRHTTSGHKNRTRRVLRTPHSYGRSNNESRLYCTSNNERRVERIARMSRGRAAGGSGAPDVRMCALFGFGFGFGFRVEVEAEVEGKSESVSNAQRRGEERRGGPAEAVLTIAGSAARRCESLYPITILAHVGVSCYNCSTYCTVHISINLQFDLKRSAPRVHTQ